MDELAARMRAHDAHLRGVAYRMLGSKSEADDAVQEAWIRLSRADTADIANLGGWLTTVVSRVCLDMLRARRARREELRGAQLESPLEALPRDGAHDPESELLVADAVGVALLVVLDTLAPAERVAFVLHDLFDRPFEEIASVVDRSPAAARQLASRARRRVHDKRGLAAPDLARQRDLVEAFLAASRDGDLDALLRVLDPDVVLRADRGVTGGDEIELRGAAVIARQARAGRVPGARAALVDGAMGIVLAPRGRLVRALRFTQRDGRIVEIDVIGDPDRLARLALAVPPP